MGDVHEKQKPFITKTKLLKKSNQQGILSEVLLWKQIKNKSLGVEFHRQIPIDNYIADFFCDELMLAIEVDGNSHNADEVAENDIERQQKLEELGVNFIRVGDIDVKQRINIVIWTLESKIEEMQGANIPLPPSKGE